MVVEQALVFQSLFFFGGGLQLPPRQVRGWQSALPVGAGESCSLMRRAFDASAASMLGAVWVGADRRAINLVATQLYRALEGHQPGLLRQIGKIGKKARSPRLAGFFFIVHPGAGGIDVSTVNCD